MSLDKVLKIKEEFNKDNCFDIIFRALDYQYIFGVSYDRALDCVRCEYTQLNEYKK